MAKSKGEQYFIDRLNSEKDPETGVIKKVDSETRKYLKNRYRRLNMTLPEQEQMHSISEMIARLIPGAVYVTNEQSKKINYSKEAILARLEKVVVANENGEQFVDLGKDEGLKDWFKNHAKRQGLTEQELLRATGFRIQTILDRDRTIPIEVHAQNILACADAKKNIVGLSKKFPSTHHYISYIAKKNKCSYNIAVNKLLGSELQEYTYIGVKNKLSKFDKENPAYIGNDQKFKESVVNVIMQCADEKGNVKGLYAHPTLYKMLLKISEINETPLPEIIAEFVPGAVYEVGPEVQMRYHTKEEVIKNLSRFDDGSGCVDSIRKNKNAIKALRRFAKAEGLHMSEFVEKYSDCYFSSCVYEVDYIDYVIKNLVSKYGFGGDVSGLSVDNPKLYDAVHRIKNFFPGGAKVSMEETLVALGFSYNGIQCETKFTEEYVGKLLNRYFGDSDGLIDSIYDLDDVGVAVMAYSGKVGLSIKDTLESFGYTYLSENVDAKKRLTGKKLTLEEYKKYRTKNINSDDGEMGQW